MGNPFSRAPAPPGFAKGKVLPETSSSWLSRLTFWWMSPFLSVGFSRPLMEDDFWELPQPRHTDPTTDRIEENFYSRCPPEKRPSSMAPTPNDEKDTTSPASENTPPSKYDESFSKALYKTFTVRIWLAIFLNIVGDALTTTTPLVNKVLITWLTDSYVYYQTPETDRSQAGLMLPRPVGFGIGLAFVIFAMQIIASVLTNHSYLMSLTTGLYTRTGIIGIVFRKSLRLSGKARLEHTVGQITTLISADATRVNEFVGISPHLIVAPVQLILGIGLLIGTLGYSVLAGFAVMVATFPIVGALMAVMLTQSRKGLKITDHRVRLTTEVLQGIRLIKVYGWEAFYNDQVTKYRTREIATVRKASIALSFMMAMFNFIPILCTVVAFITYALTGHELNIATIFTALQLFNTIRFPLFMFPMVLSSLIDCKVSLVRISKFLLAEELRDGYLIADSPHPSDPAVHVNGSFEWETVPSLNRDASGDGGLVALELEDLEKLEKKKEEEEEKKKKEEKKRKKAENSNSTPGKRRWWNKKSSDVDLQTSTAAEENEKPVSEEQVKEEEKPFGLRDLKFDVPRGSFVAIVGKVGSGKSSILQALIGEMKRTNGEVIFSSNIAYVPQVPWIKNATVRENITFGSPFDQESNIDQERYRQAISGCNLNQDLSTFPNGDQTEIGEKGINMSGGQKARVSLARACYSSADIVLLDDPLSAVDAYVGKYLVDHCLLSGPLAKRTRILVTHALHMLHKTDYIYVVDEGRIVEQGTYDSLMLDSLAFRSLMEEHGNKASEAEDLAHKTDGSRANAIHDGAIRVEEVNKLDAALMQLEERNTGAVGWHVYKRYLQSSGGLFWAPLIISLLMLTEAGNVTTTLFLGFWTSNEIEGFTQRQYMGVYAGLGGVVAFATFLATYAFVYMSLIASLTLFKGALHSVLHSPVSFFDTTPMGRILSRFSKDIDTIDQQMAFAFMQFASTFFSVLGSIALVFYTFPYLGTIFPPLAVLYYGASVYYRRSSVETKRLDSLLRSVLYASYSETLTGLATIRAYRLQRSAILSASQGLDLQNRAFYMTVAIQRWLGLRMDFFGNILVLGICLFGVGYRKEVSPARLSVVLTYTLSMTQIFAEIVTLFAQCEQNMNAVERIVHYVDLPPQASRLKPNPFNDKSNRADEKNSHFITSPNRMQHNSETEVPPEWPSEGRVKFTDVQLAYREGLPVVLKGVNFEVRAGEKIGIVGRTGSGKSSLIQALLRMTEVKSGSIEIDDIDIASVDVQVLRRRLGFVPQDTTLFLGTLRDNLDPERLRTDTELISVLQRAWLLPREGTIDPTVEAKFSLDSIVADEGANYSTGEKQLLALSRALVKNSKIIILDEATSSVDVETDAKVQRTIQQEFGRDKTVLCIAHRLGTVAYYDRILVMNDGNVAEFDSVLALFDRPQSIFRSLCDEANLSREDIIRIRREHGGP